MTRTFEAKPAVRGSSHLAVALVSPSGAGKTKSALRLADGFARVRPGPTVVIDTEAGRALHHSDAHKFLHIDMGPPFSPADHIAAWTEALRHNPTTIIQDSMSHEHEGPGGKLEMHAAELDRMAGQDWKKRERCTMAAWIRPVAEHNRMKQFFLQQRVNWIFCFRAKEKIKPKTGGDPIDLGWQPIGSEDLIYEMLLKVVLFPGADGKPTWRSDKMGEQELMKLPGWFRGLFETPRQLDEDIGEQLARWASGGEVSSSTATSSRRTAAAVHPVSIEGMPTAFLVHRFDGCSSGEEFSALQAEMRRGWDAIPKGAARTAVTQAFKRAESRLAGASGNAPVKPVDAGAVDDGEAAEIARIEAEAARNGGA